MMYLSMKIQFVILVMSMVAVCDAVTDAMQSKAVPLPGFDGKRGSFHTWWLRFMAYAMYYKFTQAIGKTADKNLPASESAATKDEEKAVVKANSIAMYSFTMAFQTEGLLGMIYKSRSADWPGGLAYKVVQLLFKKFAPDDIMSNIELENRLKQVKFMHRKEDPSELFERIKTIENQYEHTKVTIDNDRVLALVMDRAPVEYKAVLLAEQRRAGAALTLDDLETAMHDYWRITYGTRKDDCNSVKEVSFAGVGNGSDGSNEKKVCRFCKKEGHEDDMCWDKHEHLRPEWYKDMLEEKKKKRNSEYNEDDKSEAEDTEKESSGGHEVGVIVI